MNQKDYQEISIRLNEITPSLIDDTVAIFQKDPQLVAMFGNQLHDVAQQGIISLREVLLGALQFEHPRLLGSELQWLKRLLEARAINPQTMQTNLQHIRERLLSDLSPEHSQKVVDIFDKAVAQVQ